MGGAGSSHAEECETKMRESMESIQALINDYANGEITEKSVGFAAILAITNLLWHTEESLKLFSLLGMDKYLTLIRNMCPLTEKNAIRALEIAVSSVESEETLCSVAKKVLMALEISGSKGKVNSPAKDKNCFKRLQCPKKGLEYSVTVQNPQKTMGWTIPESFFNEINKAAETMDQEYARIQDLPKNPLNIPQTSDTGYLTLCNLEILKENKAFDELVPVSFDKKPTKPGSTWETNMKAALENNNTESIIYNLYLAPFLLSLPGLSEHGSILHTACINDNCALVEKLCEGGIGVSMCDKSGAQPIHYARSAKVVHALADHGADLNAKDGNGETVLDRVTKNFCQDVIGALIRRRIDITVPNEDGRYWLSYVIANKYMGTYEWTGFQKWIRSILRITNAAYRENKDFMDVLSQPIEEKAAATELNLTVHKGEMDHLRVLLALGAPLNYPREWDGVNNIVYCAKHNYIDRLRLLCVNGAEVFHKNTKGENAFRIAALKEHWEAAKILCKHGIDVDELANDGYSALHIGYLNKKMDLFEFCLECGCNVNKKDKRNRSVLYMAFADHNDELGERLQDKYDGDISVSGRHGNTLLHLACEENDIERMKYLIQRKICLDKANKDSKTALTETLLMENYAACDLLMESGANINFQSRDGNTSLMMIAKNDSWKKDSFQYLMDHGADPNIRNNEADFVLSALIRNHRDQEADQIFSRPDLNITDTKSPYEPITAALEIGSKDWFEKLVERGSTAGNQQYPVITKYLQSSFFDYKVLVKMSEYNLWLDVPLHVACTNNQENAFLFLWSKCPNSDRQKLADQRNSKGQTILMVGIEFDRDYAMDILMNENYNLTATDKEGSSAALYCAKYKHLDRTKTIVNMIGISAAGSANHRNESMLTYIGNNEWRDYADSLFVKEININCKEDENGIIAHYNALENKMHEIKHRTAQYSSKAKEALKRFDERVADFDKAIQAQRKKISDLWKNQRPGCETATRHSVEQCEKKIKELEATKPKVMQKKREAEQFLNKYISNADIARRMTRNDALNRMSQFEALANQPNIGNEIEKARLLAHHYHP